MKTLKKIELAKHLCLLPGIFLIVSGLMLLFIPGAAVKLFDLPNIELLKQPIALSMGIRQLAIGLMITILVFTHQVKALSYIMLIGAIVPFTDFFVFIPSIGIVSALRHAAPVPVILGLGFYLLFLQKEHVENDNSRTAL